MTGAERLSPTLRFEEGTTELDAQSLSAVSRLARAIEQGDFDGRELIFVGFSDGQGDAGANLRLSRGRSEAARLAVIDAATDGDLNRVTLSTAGFGEPCPWPATIPRRARREPPGRGVAAIAGSPVWTYR